MFYSPDANGQVVPYLDSVKVRNHDHGRKAFLYIKVVANDCLATVKFVVSQWEFRTGMMQ